MKVSGYTKIVVSATLLSLTLSSCRTSYKVAGYEGSRVAIDASWDSKRNLYMEEMIRPYKYKVDSIMTEVIGTAAVNLERSRPEDLLNNLLADVLRESATQVLGHKADLGLMNIGGIRNVITKGPITTGTVFEVLPFENSLCVQTMKGKALKELFSQMAFRGGEGISGANLVISKDRKLLECSIGGKAVDDEKLYTIATIDYIAEGNDGMPAMRDFVEKTCPDGATLRNIFLNYVKQQTAAGKEITSKVEGRIIVKE